MAEDASWAQDRAGSHNCRAIKMIPNRLIISTIGPVGGHRRWVHQDGARGGRQTAVKEHIMHYAILGQFIFNTEHFVRISTHSCRRGRGT